MNETGEETKENIFNVWSQVWYGKYFLSIKAKKEQ